MGDNWQEEARNGTMSLLSEITKAGGGGLPQDSTGGDWNMENHHPFLMGKLTF